MIGSTSTSTTPTPPAASIASAAASAPPAAFSSFDFEVFGKVQGVYFRQHVTDKADEINDESKAQNGGKGVLFGFVRNTAAGSVEGVAQSSSRQVLDEFEHFVTKVGSPASRIDRFEVRNRRAVPRPEFENFERKY
jgi:acylphosphatase